MKVLVGILVAASLAVASGCAKTDWIDRTLVTVDVTGSWSGSVGGGGSTFEVWLDLEQNGQTVKGSVRIVPGQISGDVGPIVGAVAGDVFRFRGERGQTEGELTVSGEEMDGTMTVLSVSRPASLRRTDPSSPSGSPTR